MVVSVLDLPRMRYPFLGSSSSSVTRGYMPVDVLSLSYCAVNVVLLAVGYRNVPGAGGLLAAFLTGFVVVASFRFVPRGGSWMLQFVRDAYPLITLPLTYGAVGRVNRALFPGFFDDLVLEWDRWVFGGHPNAYLADVLPSAPLSEFLHLCYFLYLSMVPLLGLTLFLRGRFERFRVFSTTTTLTFYTCFTMFLLFPVQGPYYTFPRVDAPGVFFPQLVYSVLERGASVGAAFPSSHVAVAMVVALMAHRLCRGLWPVLLTIALGITLATVYGGFHYAIDSVVGFGYGLIMARVGPRLHAALLRRVRRSHIRMRIELGERRRTG